MNSRVTFSAPQATFVYGRGEACGGEGAPIGWATEFNFDRRFSVEYDEDAESMDVPLGGDAEGLPEADDVAVRSARGDDMDVGAQIGIFEHMQRNLPWRRCCRL